MGKATASPRIARAPLLCRSSQPLVLGREVADSCHLSATASLAAVVVTLGRTVGEPPDGDTVGRVSFADPASHAGVEPGPHWPSRVALAQWPAAPHGLV